MTEKTLISIKNLRKEYRSKNNMTLALDSVDFHADYGESVAIVGDSGAGKTTLLSIIGLLLSKTSGEFYYCGENVSEMNAARKAQLRNEQFGFILQDYGLVDEMTVLENVEMPLIYSNSRCSKARRREKVLDALTKLGIGELIDKKANAISGGQKQRVAIARALINGPQIVLADEPTSALDEGKKNDVIELLLNLCREMDKTLIMITHDLGLAARFDRVVKLKNGKVVD